MAFTDHERHQPARPRLLAIAECLPRPDVSAGSSRLLAILAQLACVADVDFWVELDETVGDTPLPPTRIAADRERLEALGIDVLPNGWRPLHRALATGRYQAVLFEFYYVAARYLPIVADHQPGASLIVDSVDVHFARLARGAHLGTVHPSWARDVRNAETAVYRSADAVIVASTDDAAVLAEEPGMPAIACVPVSVTLRQRVQKPRMPEAVFVGHFRHDPNLDGLSWFVHEAWPHVRARHANARLTVIGSYPSPAVHALGHVPGVDVLGYVPDLDPHLDRAAVAIAPLRFGAGMKGKVADAMAAGLPVVTTPTGVQGLDVVNGHHALVADTADALAAALAGLFDDSHRAATIGLAGQAHIASVCGPEAIAASLRTVLAVAPRQRTRVRAGIPLGRHFRLARLGINHWRATRARQHAARTAGQRTGLAGEPASSP